MASTTTDMVNMPVLKVPNQLYAENRQRLVAALEGKPGDAVLLQGGSDVPLHDTDVNYEFRQESYFAWAFPAVEPDCYGVIDPSSGKATLFVPRLPVEYGVWMGEIYGTDHFKAKYEVDEVRYVDELNDALKETGVTTLHVLSGSNSDSGYAALTASFRGIEAFQLDATKLLPVMERLRRVKTPLEMQVMRYVASVSSDAHKRVLRSIKPGMSEYEMEAVFKYHVYRHGGCRHVAYTCICASGCNSAVLHYGHAGAPNDRVMQDGDMNLFDMGGEFRRYAADITVSFPVNGRFTQDQKLIYNAVLDATVQVEQAMRPGVQWRDMHLLAERVILSHLARGGLLTGDLEEMMAARLGSVFMQHGLGHLIGLAVHDVGGYPAGVERFTEPGLKSLRMNLPLEEGMVLTVEPGCYFNKYCLEQARLNEAQSKFIVWEQVQRFTAFGGVRLEDNVAVTADGIELLSQVPRTIEEVEAVMAMPELPM